MKNNAIYLLVLLFTSIAIIFGRELGDINLIGKFNYFLILWTILFICSISNYLKPFPLKSQLLVFIVLCGIAVYKGYTNGNPSNQFYDLILLTVFYALGYHSFTDEQRIDTLFHIIVISWFVKVIYTEIMFQSLGTSMFFSFANLRGIGDIRQSSDTISSVAVVILIISFAKGGGPNKLLNRYKFILIPLASFILIRYDVRSSIYCLIIIAMFYFYISRYYENINIRKAMYICLSVFVLATVLCLYIYSENIEQYMLNRPREDIAELNTTWRLAHWYAAIRTTFENGQYLIGTVGQSMNDDILSYLNITSYENPHNSYVLIFANFGGVALLTFLYILINSLHKFLSYLKSDTYIRICFYLVLCYSILAISTSIYEIPYQGFMFWLLLGIGMRRISEAVNNTQERTNLTSTVVANG